MSFISPITDSAYLTFLQAGAGAVTRSVQSKLRDVVSVKDFGAVGDGVADDTAAIQAGISACQTASLTTLYFPTGVYKITTTITLPGPGNVGIAFVGDGFGQGSQQQGSVRPATTLRWVGGAAAMFTVAGTFYRFVGMAIENFGSATDFLDCTGAMHMVLENLSFDVGSGATRFSNSVIKTQGNWLGYSKIIGCQVVSPAPRFIKIDGQGTGNGITTLQISECIFDTFTSAPMTVVGIKDESIDILTLNNNTFNQQNNAELTVVETNDTPVAQAIFSLQILYNEFDIVSNDASHRALRLTNCPNVCFVGNQIQAGGTITRLGDLVNSVITKCEANHVNALNGPLFNLDSTSRVYSGVNYLAPGNTDYLVNNTAATSGLIEMPYGTTVIVKGGLGVGTGTTVYRVEVTNTTPFALSIARPSDSSNQSFMTRGQVFSVQVLNQSGGTITINPEAAFRLAGGAFPKPANGHSRTVMFVWNGSEAVELARTPQDIPIGVATTGALEYGEGTWTPELRGSGTAGTYETTTATGWYTRIGRTVNVNFKLQLSSVITGGGTGFAVITGLPFNVGITNSVAGSVIMSGVDFNASASYVALNTRSAGSAQLIFEEVFANGAIDDVAIADFAANDVVIGSITYLI